MKPIRKILLSISRIALGIMFLWSSVPKIIYIERFEASVVQLGLTNGDLAAVTAHVIPWLELLLGLCLVSSLATGGALLLTVMLMLVFTFVHAWVLFRGIEVDCTCFSGTGGEPISAATLVRNLILLLISVVTLFGTLLNGRFPAAVAAPEAPPIAAPATSS